MPRSCRDRRAMKSRSSRLTLTGSRAWGRWPDPSRTASAPFASSASRAPDAHGRTCVVAAVDHEDRTVDPGQERPHVRLVLEPGRQLGGDQRRGVRLEPPSDGVLVRLRRVRLGQALREEELEEVLVVLGPVVAVELPPADVLVARLPELLDRPSHEAAAGDSGRAGAMKAISSTRSGCCAARSSDRSAPLDSETSTARSVRGRVHHRERVGDEFLLPVRLGVGRPVRAAVAASVEREDPPVPARGRGSASSSGANG